MLQYLHKLHYYCNLLKLHNSIIILTRRAINNSLRLSQREPGHEVQMEWFAWFDHQRRGVCMMVLQARHKCHLQTHSNNINNISNDIPSYSCCG